MTNVLMLTTEYPSEENPLSAPFVKRQKDKLESLGVSIHVLHFRGGGNPLNYVKAFFRVKTLLKNHPFHLVHAQWGQSALPAIFFNKPLVITYRGDDLEGVYSNKGGYGFKSIVLKIVGRTVAKFADHVILVSEHMRSLIKTTAPISVIPSGIDFNLVPIESKEELRIKLNLPLDKKIIIFPNDPKNLRKNFTLVKAAYEALQLQHKDIFLHVVYDVSHKLMLEHIKASDFLFFASFHEGSPNVVKEALACNTPVISVPVADVPFRLNSIPGCFVSLSYQLNDFIDVASTAMQTDYKNFNSFTNVAALDEDILTQKVLEIYKSVIQKH